MREAYTAFAGVYDIFMEDVPYEEWAAHLAGRLASYGVKDGLVLDLGCGTGTMTRLLADYGYDMIGVDGSEDMLWEARSFEEEIGADEDPEMESEEADPESTSESEAETESEEAPETKGEPESEAGTEPGILYLQQDMRELELFGTVRAVVSVCDCINYITDPGELTEVFRRVNNYLDPGGYFFFDINSVYKYATILGESTIAENGEGASFIWENTYDPQTRINEYDLTLFIEEEEGLYRKTEEVHRQRAYSLEEIRGLLEAAGMEYVGAFDGYSDRPAGETSEKILIIAREKYQEGKYYEQTR